jgi:hypothetical protein
MSHYCNNIKCRKYYNDFKFIKKEEGKVGKYYPYRDTMESERYTFTELTLKCLVCGDELKVEKDENYEMSQTDMEKYGYRGANY